MPVIIIKFKQRYNREKNNLMVEIDKEKHILHHPSLISFWDFQEAPGKPRVAKGPYPYILKEAGGPVDRIAEGIWGKYSAHMQPGKWFSIPRSQCPALDIHGPQAQLTILAWIKREAKTVQTGECQAVAGIWNESRKQRQYCLFIDLRIHDSQDQACGHVSSVGGPTPGYPYCMDAAIGKTPLGIGEWHYLAFTYDSEYSRIFLDGRLDTREQLNPYAYKGGLYNGGPQGADFTVGAVDRSGEIGNWFTGLIGGLAVFNRAISTAEIKQMRRF
jgi:hypothetical protein